MDLHDLALANRRHILKMLISKGSASRTEIARQTGIAMSSLTEIINKLIQRGILIEHKQAQSKKRGRPALTLELNTKTTLIILTGYDHGRALNPLHRDTKVGGNLLLLPDRGHGQTQPRARDVIGDPDHGHHQKQGEIVHGDHPVSFQHHQAVRTFGE